MLYFYYYCSVPVAIIFRLFILLTLVIFETLPKNAADIKRIANIKVIVDANLTL